MKNIIILLIALICSLNTFGQWKELNYGTKESLTSIYFVNDTIGYVSVSGVMNASILKTIDGGSNWSKINLNTISYIDFISFGNSKVGYILAEYKIFKTIDGGNNWNMIKYFGSNGPVKLLNKDTLFVVTASFIYRTTNGGVLWDSTNVKDTNGLRYGLKSILFPSKNVGYILYSGSSQGNVILKTTNMGATWKSISLPTDKLLYHSFFTTDSIGYIIGNNNDMSFMLKTKNGGLNWDVKEDKIPGIYSGDDFLFTDTSTAYLISSFKIYKTTDACVSWNEMNIPASIATNIFFPSNSVGYAICFDNSLLKLSSSKCTLAFNSQPSDKVVTSGNNIQFKVTSNAASATYQWQTDFGLGYQDLKNINIYSGTKTSTLQINSVSVSNHLQPFRAIASIAGCSATSNIAILRLSNITYFDTVHISVTDTLIINSVLTGLASPNNMNVIKVFPNPAKTHIYIDNGNYSLMTSYKVRIDNNTGQQVFIKQINQQKFDIDLSSWNGKGLYLLYIIDEQNKIIDTRKIILQ
jgi:photosystem II stability/assembly factor-like uncharacterized protein